MSSICIKSKSKSKSISQDRMPLSCRRQGRKPDTNENNMCVNYCISSTVESREGQYPGAVGKARSDVDAQEIASGKSRRGTKSRIERKEMWRGSRTADDWTGPMTNGTIAAVDEMARR